MTMTLEQRLDNLLAMSLAQKAVLEEVVKAAFPTSEERNDAADRASEGMEMIYGAVPVGERANLLLQFVLNDIEQIFRGVQGSPPKHEPERG